MIFDIFIPGHPRPAGSKTAYLIKDKFGRPVKKNGREIIVVTDASGKRGKEWRKTIKVTAQEATQGAPLLTGPLLVCMTFYMPRPKNHYGTGKNAERLKDSSPTYHTTKPDLLKVARAVEDALTGVCYVDDSQIVTEQLQKRYADDGNMGVSVQVGEV